MKKYRNLKDANKHISELEASLNITHSANLALGKSLRDYEQKFLIVADLSAAVGKEMNILEEQFELIDKSTDKYLEEADKLVEDAQNRERIIRQEAERYRQDYFKLVTWLCANGFENNCANAATTITELIDLFKKKIEAKDAYLEEILAELREIMPVAHVHGWQTSRYEKGIALRAAIEAVDSQIEDKKLCK